MLILIKQYLCSIAASECWNNLDCTNGECARREQRGGGAGGWLQPARVLLQRDNAIQDPIQAPQKSMETLPLTSVGFGSCSSCAKVVMK